MALDKISICNEALAEVPCEPIADFDEDSVAASWCARRFGPALSDLLGAHEWKFAATRQALALVTNDRPGEWTYAYELPGNVATELRVIPSYVSVAATIPLLAGQRLAPTVAYFFPASIAAYQYLLAGSKLYTNVQDAVLEYIADDATESVFSAGFIRALVLELASRLAVPILKEGGRARQGDLIKMAEVARDRAIAHARNSDPMESRYDQFQNETQLAREGFGSAFVGDWVTR